MSEEEVLDAAQFKASRPQRTRKTPAQLLMERRPPGYKTFNEMAELMDCHVETLRRLSREGRVNAPSKAMNRGSMVIYLFTPEDVEELEEYFNKRGQDNE